MNNKKQFLNKTKLEFYKEIKKYQQELKPTKEIEGFASSAIVGEKNYPNLKVHNISNDDKKNSFFNSSNIIKQNYSDIIKLKAKNILGSTQSLNIKKINTKIREELENIYKSKREIEFSSKFRNELKFDKILTSKVSGIMGSKNELTKINPNENTKTSNKIEKYTANDIKSKEAIISLYEKGVNESQIQNLLALGSFGINFNKKLVPTKWAISAFDQTIEKHLYKKIIKYNPINNYEIYTSYDKGNTFIIILIPDTFSAEIVEAFDSTSQNSKFSEGLGIVSKKNSLTIERDFVNFENKLKKSEPETAGGFWATKMPIQEYLLSRKKQASFISIRIIENYDIPLGVIFVREKVRDAMKNKIFSTSNENNLFEFLKIKYPKHFSLFENSILLKEQKKQTKLKKFL